MDMGDPGPGAHVSPGAGPGKGLHCRIVGIGASAGGLAAISELLRELPADLDLAIVVLMHLDPTHESSLAELLGHSCRIPVRQVAGETRIEPGRVYVIAPNSCLTVHGNALLVTARPVAHDAQRVIDQFLCSLAEQHDGCSIGVILSGSGSDGTAGLMAIRAAHGITFAQDASAAHGDMPQSAIAAGCVDTVLAPAGQPRLLPVL